MHEIPLVINSFAIANILTLFLLLFFRKNNALANRILGTMFLIPGIYFTNSILLFTDLLLQFPYFFHFAQGIALLFPILVFRYFNLLLGKKSFRLKKVLYAGSFILLIYLVFISIRFGLLTSEEKHDYLSRLTEENYPVDMLIYTIAFYTWQMVYFSASTFIVIKYKQRIERTISDLESVQYLYIEKFVYLLWTFNILLLAAYIFFPMFYVDYVLLPLIVNILYLFLIYFGFQHNAIFTQGSFQKLSRLNAEMKVNEPKEPDLPAAALEKQKVITRDVKDLLENKKIYRNTELNIKSLSEEIDQPAYLVSQTINTRFEKSFFELINEYRISDAKQRLKNMSPIETIEGIAYDTGFKSRASFYRSFKKFTGKTPTEYLNN